MTAEPAADAAASWHSIAVWDPVLRLLHWTLAASFALAWLTGEAWMDMHEGAGYAILAFIAVRAVWGLCGPRHARFDAFVPTPREVLAYLRALAAGRAPRYLGHNPAGGAMIVALLASLLTASATGVLTDSLGEPVEALHELAANVCLALVLVHLAGVIGTSLLHRENLVAAMITGRKRRS